MSGSHGGSPLADPGGTSGVASAHSAPSGSVLTGVTSAGNAPAARATGAVAVAAAAPPWAPPSAPPPKRFPTQRSIRRALGARKHDGDGGGDGDLSCMATATTPALLWRYGHTSPLRLTERVAGSGCCR
eukprot:scaffold60783_cov63-Phaeocystis_antarctica.AAC.2